MPEHTGAAKGQTTGVIAGSDVPQLWDKLANTTDDVPGKKQNINKSKVRVYLTSKSIPYLDLVCLGYCHRPFTPSELHYTREADSVHKRFYCPAANYCGQGTISYQAHITGNGLIVNTRWDLQVVEAQRWGGYSSH